MKPRVIGSSSVANWSKSLAAIADVGGKFLHRELSQLAFNERVLAMATRDDVPLAERLRYICIVSSNLDEFFEVRLTDLTEEMRERPDGAGRDELPGDPGAGPSPRASPVPRSTTSR